MAAQDIPTAQLMALALVGEVQVPQHRQQGRALVVVVMVLPLAFPAVQSLMPVVVVEGRTARPLHPKQVALVAQVVS